MNAETAGHAGTPQLKLLVMENIKELRKRNRAGSIDGAMLLDSQSDQAISHANSTRGPSDVRPGPGLKLQASSFRTNLFKQQATSVKPRGTSFKRQATSNKLIDP